MTNNQLRRTRVGVLGTGAVGQRLAAGFTSRGHEVMIGSRDPRKPELSEWLSGEGAGVKAGTFAEAAAHGGRLVLAVRGNAASNLHIEGNSISNAREVALYSEFGFQGALIANNTVDGAAIGISVTNFNEGGRLAVVQGNIIRNLFATRPAGTDPGDGAGLCIAVEADTAATGNVVALAPTAGIMLGFGRYLRDVAATGNVVRKADIGIAVSVAPGAGSALIANNVLADVLRGAIVGMDGRRIVTGDLMKGGTERYANLSISGNRAR